MSLSSLSGQISIQLICQRQTEYEITAVELQSDRLRLTPNLLRYKPLNLAPKVLGSLFSLCGTAQTVAALQACEAVAEQALAASSLLERQQAIQIETVFEHSLRLGQDWAQALSIPPLAPEYLRQLFQMKRELNKGLTPLLLARLQQALEQHLLGLKLHTWLQLCEQGDVAQLKPYGLVGQLLSQLAQQHWLALGNNQVQALPAALAHNSQWWQQQLTQATAEDFCALPTFNGCACETSSFTRQCLHPALQAWQQVYGSGLATRLIARVLDLIVHLQGLQQTESADLISTAAFAKTGWVSVGTARGLLVHRVYAEAAGIQVYQIVAPTEWNFHPQGSLARMLQSLRTENLASLRQQAQALITALDPCVNYQLEIKSDA
jgi:hypothetical protein